MLKFSKFTGAGNDFIVIDNRQKILTEQQFTSFCSQHCPRGTGVGADGVLLLEESEEADFRMRIINADGSEAEMCGNGIRCLAFFAHKLGYAEKAVIETLAGKIQTWIKGNQVRVKLTETEKPVLYQNFAFAGQEQDIYFLNTGVPHTVIPVANLEKIKIQDWGKAVRYAENFAPVGTNVNFMEKYNGNEIKIRTYERGVEAETLACGTGSTAAAIVAAELWQITTPIKVHTKSGEILEISFRQTDNSYENVILSGPVKEIYRGELQSEV